MAKRKAKKETAKRGKKTSNGQRLPDVLEEEQLDALLDAPSKRSMIGIRNRSVLTLMGRCGLRVSEVCNLRTSDLQVGTNTPHVKVIGKGDKERRAWLGNGTRDLLALWLEKRPKKGRALFPVIQGGARRLGKAKPGRAISPRSVRNMVEHYAKKAGIRQHVHPHTLRHTAATLAIRKGEAIPAVRDMLGHANMATTNIYTHVAGKDLSAMAQRLDPGNDPAETKAADLAATLKELPAETRKALAAALLEE